MFKDRIGKMFKELAKELAEERLANNRLMAVSGMSTEELTDAFTKGYRLVSPEAVKDDIPDDLRIAPKNTTNWIPVTKRLPDDYDRYLITTDEGRVEMVGYGYTNDLPNEIAFYQWDDEEWQCWKPNVTAWMPLPKPYEPQEREGHMNCEDCDYTDIADWEQDKKTGKAKPVYWCERYRKLCSSISECQYKAESEG